MKTVTSRWWQVASKTTRLALELPSFAALLLLTFLFFVGFARNSLAQTGNATVSGRVTDPKGGIIPHTTVEAIQEDTNVKTTAETNGDGLYYFASLRPAGYRIVVSKDGFKQVVQSGVVLHTQDSVTLNFSLEIGSMSETVTVTGANERMPTDNPAVGLLVDRTFVENMPLNGRSFQDLISLAPGAITSANENGLFSVNGQRDNGNYFTVDGVASNLNPNTTRFDPGGLSGTYPAATELGTTQALASVDALQEFNIQTSGYTAEYGRQPGGQVAITTRAGTNDLHGSLFDYFRNTVLDANDWFSNQAGIPRQPVRQNDFGGTLGGPVEIPRLYDGKNKTFYFVAYEGLRETQPVFSGTAEVPTAALRQFAAAGVQPFLNSMPLPNVKGHLDNGDQCMAPLDPNYPNLAPTSPYAFSCTGEFAFAVNRNNSLDALSLRVDRVIGRKLQLFLRYSDTPSQAVSVVPVSQDFLESTNSHTWTLGTTVKINSNWVDELRFNFSVSGGHQFFYPVNDDGSVAWPRSLLVPAQYLPYPGASFSSQVQFNLSPISFLPPSYTLSASNLHQYNLIDSFSWIRDGHSVKFGVDYRRLHSLGDYNAYYSTVSLITPQAVQEGFADDVALGANSVAHPIFQNLSLYAQDHWSLSARLTVDYGLRWEFNPAPGAADGRYPLALTSSDLATTQLASTGSPQYHTRYDDFAPRLGFAYNWIRSSGRPVVVRGGVGLFYDTGQDLGAAGYQGYPFGASSSITDLPLPAVAYAIAPPLLNGPLSPPYPFIQVNDPNLRLPYTEQWNLSIDEGLGAKNTLTVSYVGNEGKKLLFTAYYASLLSNPLFTRAFITNNAGSSSYHGLQVQDQGYVTRGFQVIASYTWSHAIDDGSTNNGDIAGGFQGLAIPDRGNADNDIRQVFNFAMNYAIPGATSSRLLRSMTGGWLIANRFFAQSGYPIDVTQGQYFLANGSEQFIRPDLVPDVPIVLHNQPNVLGGWELNPAAFSPVPTDPNTGAPLRQGDLTRNFIHGPAFWSLNTSLERNFPIRDNLKLAFRVDAFNVFNHPNAGGIDSCLCDGPTFGQSNTAFTQGGAPTIGAPSQLYGTGAARSLQLMLKLQF